MPPTPIPALFEDDAEASTSLTSVCQEPPPLSSGTFSIGPNTRSSPTSRGRPARRKKVRKGGRVGPTLHTGKTPEVYPYSKLGALDRADIMESRMSEFISVEASPLITGFHTRRRTLENDANVLLGSSWKLGKKIWPTLCAVEAPRITMADGRKGNQKTRELC